MKGLKGLLQLVGFGALTYVAVIAAVIAIRIGPTARALRAHSEQVRQQYQAISDRSAALYATIDEIQMWLYTVARPSALKPGLDILRHRIDSLTSPALAPRLSQIPTAMRVDFTKSSVEQSRLGVLLLEVLANIEQGRTREALQQLAMADSIARAADRDVAAAQRVGLDDLIAREQSLAGAARASVEAIGIWAALGLVIAPFVVIFLRRRFYGPLADLTDGIQQVADGDLTWTVPVRHSDELGRVSEHFNQATAVLRQRADEVRERALAALQQSEARYESMVEYAPIGIAVVDPAGRYVHTNAAFQRFLGYGKEELNGKFFHDVTAPEDVADSKRRFAGLTEGRNDRYRLEKSYIRKDGTRVWARVSIAGVRDATGALVHTISMIEDISDEKQLQVARDVAEKARRKSEEKFATAFRMNPNPSVIARLADGILVEVNDAYSAVSGFSRDEVIGKSAREMLWAVPERRDEFVAQLREHGRIRDLEQKMKTKSGPQLDVLLSVEVIELDGVPHVLTSGVDITNRKQAAEALRQSEEKFSKVFRASPNSIVITEEESGVLVDANDAFFAIAGYTREEALGQPMQDLVWRNAEQRSTLLAKLDIEGRVSGEELELHTKSGGTRYSLVSVERIELAGRRYLLSEGLDVTERKQAAQALRESEERYRSLVEASPDAISVVQDRRVVFANPAGLALIRGTKKDLIGHPVIEFVTDEYVERSNARLDAILAGMKDDVEEVQVRTIDGQVITAETTGILIQFQGRPAVLVIHRDVTARKEAEQQLRLLAQAVKSTQESIAMTDVEGRLIFVNRGFTQTCGYSEAELIGQHISLINSPRNRPGLQEEVHTATLLGGTWSGELYNRRKDGTDFLISLTTASARDDEGNVIALMGVSSDITERKLLEESVRRAATMSALGAVVAGVAHEVRNPLFGISATVDAFEARFGADPAQSRYTQTLRQEVGRLTKLMQDLLEYGKPPRLEITVGAIAPVIRRAMAASASLAESSGIWVREELPADLPPIPMDQSRMQQVFQNLIDNAIQHSPRGAGVTISGHRSGSDEQGMLNISITDQGAGFKEEDLPRLFEPFFTRRRGGTGLGLSIVQRILEQHDGDIVARNAPGGGAVITIRLPLSRQRRPYTRAEAARV